jgi:gliding motility-associated protein GldM
MSIPKEPRQLMINLMYLVLTAMLALNVSAEIINAFFSLNKGIKDSSKIVDSSNGGIISGIETAVRAQPKYAEFLQLANQAKGISDEFKKYMEGINSELVQAAGGVDDHYTDGRPKKYKDKDIPTNLFLSEAGGKGRGEEIKKKIAETRERLLALIKDPKDKENLAKQMPLMVDETPQGAEAKSWVDLKFKQMPVAAVMPALSKISADAVTSETAILNYCLDKSSGKQEIKFDAFNVAIAPKKSYLLRGEKFEADVYLAAYSKTANNVSISVNGSGLPVNQGVAKYSATAEGLGEKTVNASATLTNPFTGERQTVTGTFKYEVGQSSVAVEAEKMNVFYIGVKNPIVVSAQGISSNDLKVTCDGCSLESTGNQKYDAVVQREGKVYINIAGGGLSMKREFRAKKIPNPIAKLTNRSIGGAIPAGTMQAQTGLIAELENFDFDARCNIERYVMVYVPRRDDPRQANVNGGAFTDDAKRMVQSAKPGDSYNIMNIRGRCPGDAVARDLGSMSVMVR